MSDRLHTTLGQYYDDVAIQPISGGHTLAERAIAILPGHGRCFVKVGYDERTRAAIATEASVLMEVRSPHLPRLIRHEPGMLIVEDLTGAHWPPPWTDDLRRLWHALESLAGEPAPSVATPLEDDEPWQHLDGVSEQLGAPLTRWLRNHLDHLNDSAAAVSPVGSDFVHADLSLDNLCVAERGVVLVDWEFASIGNRELDIATVSLELVSEGLSPHLVPLANRSEWAARLAIWMLAGIVELSEWAVDPEALRSDRLTLAEVALRWWATDLALSPPPPIAGGPHTG